MKDSSLIISFGVFFFCGIMFLLVNNQLANVFSCIFFTMSLLALVTWFMPGNEEKPKERKSPI